MIDYFYYKLNPEYLIRTGDPLIYYKPLQSNALPTELNPECAQHIVININFLYLFSII